MKRRLFLEDLESRRLLAGDLSSTESLESLPTVQSRSSALDSASAASAPANDLVAFAKALENAGLRLFGAAWDASTTEQRELFEDGADSLSFVEVTAADRSPNALGTLNNITTVPTWIRADGLRLEGFQTIQQLSDFAGLAIPQNETPSLQRIGDLEVKIGSPLHLPINAYDPNGGPLTVTVSVDQTDLLDSQVLAGNRSIRMDIDGYGDMVYELFEQRAPSASSRVIDLALNDFYDGVIFHRVIDDFVIQAGDPTATGSGGSNLPDFDDEFHPDLQHNRPGVLSFAKSSDDTNNSQFFVTEVPTRFLDFNHSVFGQLIEGTSVREAIGGHAADESQRPTFDITIESIDVFEDTENALVMLKALGSVVGSTNVTVTVIDQDGNSAAETFSVDVVKDDADSQPFLDPIETPAAGPIRRAQTLQLTSTDVEGDPVTYLAQLASPIGAAEVRVDDSGLLTVTPIDHFTGVVEVAVGVRRAVGGSSSDLDRQYINFTFDNSLTIPPLIDLAAESDSGISDTDNLTNQTTIIFHVQDTAQDDVIELLINGKVAESRVATGQLTTFSTDAIAELGDGTHSVSVRMMRSDETLLGNSIDVNFDATRPQIDAATIPPSVTVGQSLSALLALKAGDVISEVTPSTSSGQVALELSSGPEGMTLDGATVRWMPIPQQLGPHAVRFRTTDPAGNTFVETFVMEVLPDASGSDPLVQIELSTTDMDGNTLAQFEVGQPFRLIVRATDLRAVADRQGVFSAFADLLFDTRQLGLTSTGGISHGDDFTVTPDGLVTLVGIDELGAANAVTTASLETTSLIATVQLNAVAAGSFLIASNPAEDTGHDLLLYGMDQSVPADQVTYGTLEIEITAPWHRPTTPWDVNGDGTVSPRDALAVINVLAVRGGSFSVYAVDKSQFNPDARFDVIADGLITPRDALVVINRIALQTGPNAPPEQELMMNFLRDFRDDEEINETRRILALSPAYGSVNIVTI